MFRVDGEWVDEVWDGAAEGGTVSGCSVGEGASDGAFAVCLELEVEVLHDRVVASVEVVQQRVPL